MPRVSFAIVAAVLPALLVPASARVLLASRALLENSGGGEFVEATSKSSAVPKLHKELIPLLEALQSDADFQAKAVACSRATGITSVAQEVPEVIYGALYAFAAFGSCNLLTRSAQAEHAAYMIGQGLHLHLHNVFLHDYTCYHTPTMEDQQAGLVSGQLLTELPKECYLGEDIVDLVSSVVEAIYPEGELLCGGESGGPSPPEPVTLLTLPADYVPDLPEGEEESGRPYVCSRAL